MRIHTRIAVLAAALAAAFTFQTAKADQVTVSTSGGGSGDQTTVWTVADPTAGNYTVTVTGANRSTGSDSNNYYRNSSNSTEDDRTITWTVSGLNPLYQITGFSFGTIKITPGQGSGSSWSYTDTLSATDVSTLSTVSNSGSLTGSSAGPISPAVGITGNFGNAPAFTEFVDESTPFTSRTLGTRDFTITASPISVVPEPASLGLLVIGGASLLLRRRK
ncbi:MAG TPA: PEP-CTERM sorting domain-containing protein [Phycisphaerae bacterium]|nr:PEP-CTERM sorting domain-containing protein [Phycisphaerae bacterium]